MTFGAYVQSTKKDAGAVTSSTLAYTSNVTAGDSLVANIRRGSNSGTVGASDNVNGTWTQDDNLFYTDGEQFVFRFSNTAAGATTVTVTSSLLQTLRWDQLEYGGVFTLDGKAHATANSTSPSSGAYTPTHNSAILGFMGGGNNASPNSASAGTGFTSRENLLSSSGASVAVAEDMGTVQTSGSAYTATFSWANADNWACIVLAYYDASAATGKGIVASSPRVRPILCRSK